MHDLTQVIKSWIRHISTPDNNLNGFSVCPYAKNASYEIIELKDLNLCPPENLSKIIIYKLPDELEFSELFLLAQKNNQIYPNLIFLPDAAKRFTYINNVQTNNGHFNLILCQKRNDLLKARENLLRTEYYSYWDKKYLDEIFET